MSMPELNPELETARNRLIAACFYRAAGERGGIDSEDADIEMRNATAKFDEAARDFVRVLDEVEPEEVADA